MLQCDIQQCAPSLNLGGDALPTAYLPIVGNVIDQESLIHDLLRIIRDHPEQRRKSLEFDYRLLRAAASKALELQTLEYFLHTSPDGVAPNQLVRSAGFDLPYYYSDINNNVESLSGGQRKPEEVLNGWMKTTHKMHILATTPFFQDHVLCGIGYSHINKGPADPAWVFLSAPRET